MLFLSSLSRSLSSLSLNSSLRTFSLAPSLRLSTRYLSTSSLLRVRGMEAKEGEKQEESELEKEEKEGNGGEERDGGEEETTSAAAAEHRIIIDGLPKFWNNKAFLQFLSKQAVTSDRYLKCKKIPNKSVAYMTFADEEGKRAVIQQIEGVQVKKEKIRIDPNATRPQYSQKRKREDGDGSDGRKKAKSLTIEDVVTPLHHMAYSEQVERKYREMSSILSRFLPKLREKSKYNLPTWVEGIRDVFQIIRFDGVIPTEPTGYRNKVQYTVGPAADGKAVVGYTMGQQREGNLQICAPDGCKNTSDIALGVRGVTQKIIEASPYPPYNMATNTGFWRQVTVRITSNPKQLMVVFQVNPTGIPFEDVSAEKERVTQCLLEARTIHDVLWTQREEEREEGKREEREREEKEKREERELGSSSSGLPYNEADVALHYLHSVIFQEYTGISVAPDLESEILWGSDAIYETVAETKFRISANSFFQVNTGGAERLLGVIKQWCDAIRNAHGKEVDVVDVCCGTGSIGLSLSRSVRKVMGVELCEDAVNDAKFNAKENGITNCEFVVGKAEDVLRSILHNYEQSHTDGELVGIVDPPRSGLHPSVVKSIRECRPIRHLIYVSCNQNSFLENAADLCRGSSGNMSGPCFRPVCAVCVDLFPQTPHAELVVLMERVRDEREMLKEPLLNIFSKVVPPVAPLAVRPTPHTQN